MIEWLNDFIGIMVGITFGIIGITLFLENERIILLENLVSELSMGKAVETFKIKNLDSRVEQLEDLTKYMEHDLYNKTCKECMEMRK